MNNKPPPTTPLEIAEAMVKDFDQPYEVSIDDYVMRGDYPSPYEGVSEDSDEAPPATHNVALYFQNTSRCGPPNFYIVDMKGEYFAILQSGFEEYRIDDEGHDTLYSAIREALRDQARERLDCQFEKGDSKYHLRESGDDGDWI